MTDEFRELSNRLAKGLNRDDCFAVLISGITQDDLAMRIEISGKWSDDDMFPTIAILLESTLNELETKYADRLCENVKNIIAEYEERRFQKGK